MTFKPAVHEGCRDVADRYGQHGVGEPHVHVRGQVLEGLAGFREHVRHLDAEPLHGIAAEVRLGPADCDHERGKRVERGVSPVCGGASHPLDRVRQRRRLVDEPCGDPQHKQREQRHPDGDVEVEQQLLEGRVFLDERRHRVATCPHEDEAQRHDPVNQARKEVVFLIGHQRNSLPGLQYWSLSPAGQGKLNPQARLECRPRSFGVRHPTPELVLGARPNGT